METKILYTDSGKDAIDKYFEEQKKQLEKIISEEKYVLGDEFVEITASDIKSYNEQLFQQKRKADRRKKSQVISIIYGLIGIIMSFLGLLYPIIIEMLEDNPIQFLVTTLGLLMTILGGCFYIITKKRKNESV
jgi:hypothetical protein